MTGIHDGNLGKCIFRLPDSKPRKLSRLRGSPLSLGEANTRVPFVTPRHCVRDTAITPIFHQHLQMPGHRLPRDQGKTERDMPAKRLGWIGHKFSDIGSH
jgi:hypothetical protein